MIAGLLPASHFPLHASGDEHLGRRSVEQEVVDTDAGVASVGIPEIVPEGVDRLVGIQCPEGVRPTLLKELLVGSARLREE
jgi:hypothetical protein